MGKINALSICFHIFFLPLSSPSQFSNPHEGLTSKLWHNPRKWISLAERQHALGIFLFYSLESAKYRANTYSPPPPPTHTQMSWIRKRKRSMRGLPFPWFSRSGYECILVPTHTYVNSPNVHIPLHLNSFLNNPRKMFVVPRGYQTRQGERYWTSCLARSEKEGKRAIVLKVW